MKTIFKYPLELGPDNVVNLPKGARLLKVDKQHGAMTLWALVDISAPTVTRRYAIIGTGMDLEKIAPLVLSETVVHVATVFDGAFVWHAFFDLKEYKLNANKLP